MTDVNPISHTLAEFVADFELAQVPDHVCQRAKLHILDAAGTALAAQGKPFAKAAMEGMTLLAGNGDHTIIGAKQQLPMRDAVLVNGILAHGLDFDDTHVTGVVHASVSAFPTALALASELKRSGADMLSAYIIGMETTSRLGMVAKGGFHQVGFHPTGVTGAFGCALLSGWLYGLDAIELANAQGVVLSQASGSFEFLADGAWNKRLHPGWAGVSGITAAALAKSGFLGTKLAYEGRFGFFPSHLGALESNCDYDLATADLGTVWEVANVAIKPFPVCHFNHACIDSARILRDKYNIDPKQIDNIVALVPKEAVKTVCEPLEQKLHPANGYEAQFSTPYAIACGLVRGRFTLEELEESGWHDPALLAVAEKVTYRVDPDSLFPAYYSGEVVVTMKDGTVYRHREEKNRGAGDRPLAQEEIVEKFIGNATLTIDKNQAEDICEAILNLEKQNHASDVAALLRSTTN